MKRVRCSRPARVNGCCGAAATRACTSPSRRLCAPTGGWGLREQATRAGRREEASRAVGCEDRRAERVAEVRALRLGEAIQHPSSRQHVEASARGVMFKNLEMMHQNGCQKRVHTNAPIGRCTSETWATA